MKNWLLLIIPVCFFAACENKTADSTPTTEVHTTIAESKPENIVTEPSLPDSLPEEKEPCESPKKTSKSYKNDLNGIFIEIESRCTGDYFLKDTIEHYDGNVSISAHSNYEHKMVFSGVKNGKKEFLINKQLFADSISRHHFDNFVLVKPEILSFSAIDTSATIRFLFGPAESDDVVLANFTVYFNRGVKFDRFSATDAD